MEISAHFASISSILLLRTFEGTYVRTLLISFVFIIISPPPSPPPSPPDTFTSGDSVENDASDQDGASFPVESHDSDALTGGPGVEPGTSSEPTPNNNNDGEQTPRQDPPEETGPPSSKKKKTLARAAAENDATKAAAAEKAAADEAAAEEADRVESERLAAAEAAAAAKTFILASHNASDERSSTSRLDMLSDPALPTSHVHHLEKFSIVYVCLFLKKK